MPFVLRLSKKAALAAAFALLSTAAFAQTPAPAPAPSAPPEPSAAHVALAREVVVSSGVGNSFQVVIPQILDQIGQSISRSRPELSADVNVILPGIKLDFDKKVSEMVDTAAKLYAQRLSHKELDDAAKFFKSESGRKYVGTQPILMTDMFVALQAWSQKISGDMMTRVREEMRKRGHQL